MKFFRQPLASHRRLCYSERVADFEDRSHRSVLAARPWKVSAGLPGTRLRDINGKRSSARNGNKTLAGPPAEAEYGLPVVVL